MSEILFNFTVVVFCAFIILLELSNYNLIGKLLLYLSRIPKLFVCPTYRNYERINGIVDEEDNI